MCRRILPLQALRAFEVAARHQSLSKAAEELQITPSAVHHQVRALAELLGVDLFRRDGRALSLTEAGAACFPTLERAFDLLTIAIEQARAFTEPGVLRITACPDLAARWLVPRLGRFQQSFPAIELDVSLAGTLPDFGTDTTDIAIVYGTVTPQHLVAERLGLDEVFPVCHPSLLRSGSLGHLDGLTQHPLLHDESRRGDPAYPGWREWLAGAGGRGIEIGRGLRLDSAALVLDMAAAGHGLALARASLVADDLVAGRLVRPFSHAMPVQHHYAVVSPRSVVGQPKVAAFREWLFAELSRDRLPATAPRPAARTELTEGALAA